MQIVLLHDQKNEPGRMSFVRKLSLTTATRSGLHVIKDASSYNLSAIIIHTIHVEHHNLFISGGGATRGWQTQSSTFMKFLLMKSFHKTRYNSSNRDLHIVFVREL